MYEFGGQEGGRAACHAPEESPLGRAPTSTRKSVCRGALASVGPAGGILAPANGSSIEVPKTWSSETPSASRMFNPSSAALACPTQYPGWAISFASC